MNVSKEPRDCISIVVQRLRLQLALASLRKLLDCMNKDLEALIIHHGPRRLFPHFQKSKAWLEFNMDRVVKVSQCLLSSTIKDED
jgi:hypothetical protein